MSMEIAYNLTFMMNNCQH